MKNEILFKTICEMVKQFDNLEQFSEEYWNKCEGLIRDVFWFWFYETQTILRIALFWEWEFLTDTDSEIEFKIINDWKEFVCYWNERKDFTVKYCFNNQRPIWDVLKELDKLWQTIEKFEDFSNNLYLKELKEWERNYFETLI